MADEIEFPNGLFVKPPHQNAPDFVKCAISIKIADLQEWLAGRDGDRVNLDVKESKGGKWYAVVNTYKPQQEDAAKAPERAYNDGLDDSDDPPF